MREIRKPADNVPRRAAILGRPHRQAGRTSTAPLDLVERQKMSTPLRRKEPPGQLAAALPILS